MVDSSKLYHGSISQQYVQIYHKLGTKAFGSGLECLVSIEIEAASVVVCLICLVDIGWYLAGKEETIWVKFEFD